ncbi:transketolase [Methylomarinum vadi]|uniref:transketolase n=1 Tax=Methylomarinum vadi TaxID=438855 RepID=UPI0004DF3D5C|nr:transketolase [Methylomarinum vadi]
MPTRRDLANAIRALTMDAVQKANSGHPGAPMGMADIAEVLWNDFFRHNPSNPAWPNRDRFVLSNGHGSMLLYSLLHLSGYDVSIDDLKNFRQLHSKTPGHPEYGYTPGVETTTGPLGQGISNAVGMALAERTLGAQFNRPDHTIISHYTYAFLGDGCLMEGVSHEACSLAGTMGLGKLIAFYDANGISIDGEIRGWFTDNTVKRFDAYNWHVIARVDGHNPEAIRAAIAEAKSVEDKPSLIICRTTIGYGSPNKQGLEACHGAPLGDEEIALAKKVLDWPHPAFEIPEDIRQAWDAREKGTQAEQEWQQRYMTYRNAYPELADEFERRLQGRLPDAWPEQSEQYLHTVNDKGENIASRKASQNCLNAFGPLLPELIGGSADLAGSNLTLWEGCKDVNLDDHSGNYIYYGVREFGMAAIMNGIAAYGGFIPYGATFLMFSEYARNAIRMSALMKLRVIHVFTHDSIGLGEDGPTHQPIEQTATLRMVPNMMVWRPCDAVESTAAWQAAIARHDGPTALIFSRQPLPHQKRSKQQLADIKRGAYILKEPTKPAKAIIIATGSEVAVAMEAAAMLGRRRIPVRVVSMPSTTVFDEQDAAYQERILPSNVTARVAVEAGISKFWGHYVGLQGKVVGIDRFGESAPAQQLFEVFGITAENIVKAVKSIV